jgi:hypothetical protein
MKMPTMPDAHRRQVPRLSITSILLPLPLPLPLPHTDLLLIHYDLCSPPDADADADPDPMLVLALPPRVRKRIGMVNPSIGSLGSGCRLHERVDTRDVVRESGGGAGSEFQRRFEGSYEVGKGEAGERERESSGGR